MTTQAAGYGSDGASDEPTISPIATGNFSPAGDMKLPKATTESAGELAIGAIPVARVKSSRRRDRGGTHGDAKTLEFGSMGMGTGANIAGAHPR